MSSSVGRLLDPWTDDRRLIVGPTGVLSYRALGDRIASYAGALAKQGVNKGDRVAVLADGQPDLIVALFGHHRAGVVHVPINTRYRHVEIRHILTDAQPSLVLVDDPYAELVRSVGPDCPVLPLRGIGADRPEDPPPPPQIDDQDPALMIYTSGTTGKSKGVVLSYAALVASMHALTTLWGWSAADRLVLALPLFHVHGLCIGVHGSILHRMQICLQPSFEPAAVIEAIADGGTIFMGVPTMYRRLVEYLERTPDAVSVARRARLFTSGSAPLSPDTFTRFESLTGHQIVERYGMSETLITLSNRIEGRRRPGVVGRAVPGVEARVVGDDGRTVADGAIGELQVRGGGLMTAYWNRPRATTEAFADDGWFKTGDVVRVDEDGDFQILGRKSVDIIKTGGFKVSAREIEDVLLQHDAVAEAAVIGMTDPEWGQAIHAVLVPSGASVVEPGLEAAIVAFVASRLAGYKKPQRLHWVEALPRNALGKVQKKALLTRFGG